MTAGGGVTQRMDSVGTAVPIHGTKVGRQRSLDLDAWVARLVAAQGDPRLIDDVVDGYLPSPRAVSEWVRQGRGRYTRSLVFRDELLEVLVLTWSQGSAAPIHDHAGQRCWMTVVHGALDIAAFVRTDGGRGPGPARVEPDGPLRRLQAGEVDRRDARTDLHSVRAADGCPLAISVHVYSRPLDRCLVFDPRRGAFTSRRLQYDFLGPRSRREGAPLELARTAPEGEGLFGAVRRWLRRTSEVTADLLVPAKVEDAQAQVQLREVGHRYGKVQALQDVNLNVRSGELLCLLGPSGCGKSTLLHALAGHVRPTQGVVSLDGVPVQGPGPDRLLMFQDPALFPWLTVEQNLTFVLAAQGVSRQERSPRARAMLAQVELAGFEDALPHQLSGGMKMRAALARALVVDPPVLLMDEPYGAQDAQTRLRMQVLLRDLWRKTGKTVVFVSHDVHEALFLSTRVVLLAPRPGRIVADLEVHLPHPRDPDDPALARLVSEVRHALGAAEQQRETNDADARAQSVDGYGRHRGAVGGVGGARRLGAVATAPLPAGE